MATLYPVSIVNKAKNGIWNFGQDVRLKDGCQDAHNFDFATSRPPAIKRILEVPPLCHTRANRD